MGKLNGVASLQKEFTSFKLSDVRWINKCGIYVPLEYYSGIKKHKLMISATTDEPQNIMLNKRG